MTDSNIADLCPELQTIYTKWLEQCHTAGLKLKAYVTWRSADEQNMAKAKGLSNASAGQSPHNCMTPDGEPFSKAFDFVIFDDKAQCVWDGKDPRYEQAADIGKSLGLIWGGDFHSFPDYDHMELPNWQTVSASTIST